jgi:hypothetical protein
METCPTCGEATEMASHRCRGKPKSDYGTRPNPNQISSGADHPKTGEPPEPKK